MEHAYTVYFPHLPGILHCDNNVLAASDKQTQVTLTLLSPLTTSCQCTSTELMFLRSMLCRTLRCEQLTTILPRLTTVHKVRFFSYKSFVTNVPLRLT